jgi:phosphoribosyl-dephospho-CoA transferase
VAALSLHRQQLLRLTPGAWDELLAMPWDASLQPCLALWARRGLPLVVTRQPAADAATIAAGLPAPARWGRRRLALTVEPRHVLFLDEFPAADSVARLLPRAHAAAWRQLLAALSEARCRPRVYGGYGWQALTQLTYVHAGSDLDLLLPVDSTPHADAVVRALSAPAWSGPRLDGELQFSDGTAIAWREWAAWRAGRTAQVLVKRLHGVAIETPQGEFA